MAQEYDLAAVRNLLNDAFNAGEISTLAFDLFQPVYGNFAAGMNKGQMITAIVEYANRNGRIPDLLTYVKKANAYQYGRYANQLKSIPPTKQQEPPPMISHEEQRRRDIQRNIERDMNLLRQYEEQLAYEDDPRRIMRIEREIERQKASLAKYRQEAAQLSPMPAQVSGETGIDLQASFQAMDKKLDAISQQVTDAENRLAAGQEQIRGDIAQQQQAILSHIDQRHEETVRTLLARMDKDQLETVELLLDAADNQQIAQWEAENLVNLVQHALVELHQIRENQPESAEIESLLQMLKQETKWRQKLKVAIPIAPFVAFEAEVGTDVVPALKEAMQRMVNKFKR